MLKLLFYVRIITPINSFVATCLSQYQKLIFLNKTKVVPLIKFGTGNKFNAEDKDRFVKASIVREMKLKIPATN